MQSYFLTGQFFSILPKYWQGSKYTAILSKFSFPKKGRELSLSFGWQIYVMVEQRILRSYGKLYTFKNLNSFSIRQTKLFWTNLKHYSQTCSNDHLCKTTTRLRWPLLSPPKQIPIQSLLCKTTTRLTRPATTFFVSHTKKNLSKTTTKNFIQRRNAKQT